MGAAIHEHGLEPNPGRAHITVMDEQELSAIGGVDKIRERGQSFKFKLGAVKHVNPRGWDKMSQVYFVVCTSPELKKLRKSYGLKPLYKGHEFHITVAVRPKMGKTAQADVLLPMLAGGGVGLLGDLIRKKKKGESWVSRHRRALIGTLLGAGVGGAAKAYNSRPQAPAPEPVDDEMSRSGVGLNPKRTEHPTGNEAVEQSILGSTTEPAPAETSALVGRLNIKVQALNTDKEGAGDAYAYHANTYDRGNPGMLESVSPEAGAKVVDAYNSAKTIAGLEDDQAAAMANSMISGIEQAEINDEVPDYQNLWLRSLDDAGVSRKRFDPLVSTGNRQIENYWDRYLSAPNFIGDALASTTLGAVGGGKSRAARLLGARKGFAGTPLYFAGGYVGQKAMSKLMDTAGVQAEDTTYVPGVSEAVKAVAGKLGQETEGELHTRSTGRVVGDVGGGALASKLPAALRTLVKSGPRAVGAGAGAWAKKYIPPVAAGAMALDAASMPFTDPRTGRVSFDVRKNFAGNVDKDIREQAPKGALDRAWYGFSHPGRAIGTNIGGQYDAASATAKSVKGMGLSNTLRSMLGKRVTGRMSGDAANRLQQARKDVLAGKLTPQDYSKNVGRMAKDYGFGQEFATMHRHALLNRLNGG